MFFLPWAIGIVIMVLACIAGVVFIRVLPLWFGGLLGVCVIMLCKIIFQLDDFLPTSLTLTYIPSILFTCYYIKKTNNKLEQYPRTAINIIKGLPVLAFSLVITSGSVLLLLNTVLDPIEHSYMSPYMDMTNLLSTNVEKWNIQVDSWREAKTWIGNTLVMCGVSIFFMGIIVFIKSFIGEIKSTKDSDSSLFVESGRTMYIHGNTNSFMILTIALFLAMAFLLYHVI